MTFKKRIKLLMRSVRLFFTKEKYNGKVFCIGFNKTGTTTLGKSLEMLGYRNSTFNPKIWKLYKNGDIDSVLRYTAKFDSCDDLPWLKQDMIPILDKTFPKSKFIYLERDEEEWKRSVKEWKSLKDQVDWDTETAFKNYLTHQKFILHYFSDQKNFLTLNIKDPVGFEKLASFLGKKAPQKHFPHFNKTEAFRITKANS